MEPISGFILTRHIEYRGNDQVLVFWLLTERGPKCVEITTEKAVCFVLTEHQQKIDNILQGSGIHWSLKPLQLKTFQNQSVSALYCQNRLMQYQALKLLKGYHIPVWEDDISPTDRFLMERNIQAGMTCYQLADRVNPEFRVSKARIFPQFKVLSLDIETSAWAPDVVPEIYCISLTNDSYRWTGLIHHQNNSYPEPGPNIEVVSCLEDLLAAFLKQVELQDPDVIIGWNVINFDFRVLQYWFEHTGIRFSLGRQQAELHWRQPDVQKNQWLLTMPGRIVLDGIDVLRVSFHHYENYSLDHVAGKVVGQSKLISGHVDKVAEIDSLYRSQPNELIDYNLQDCLLVSAIFAQLNLLEFLVERAYLTGLPLDRMGGSAAAFNNLYLPRLHRSGFVAPSVGSQTLTFHSPGGYVFDSIPGLYRQILVLDFKSLYPSIILTFLIDPMGLIRALAAPSGNHVPGFDGGVFDRDHHILPALIQQLWQQRDLAKQQNNSSLSQAIKILMNSFYGVLGSDICRFFDPRLSSSITKRGHEIMTLSKDWIEHQGYQVIYGDTDSLFVHVASAMDDESLQGVGKSLAFDLNQYWQQLIQDKYDLKSHLEIEFETCYQRFLMPRIRNAEKGSKKRYAGKPCGNKESDIVFKGLEAVRTDWTPLAKEFQVNLYNLVFNDMPVEDWIKQFVADVRAGKKDNLLVFTRRVKKNPEDYHSGLPPSAQAVAQLQTVYPGRHYSRVEYVITLNGVEAKELQQSRIDYNFYIERQIKPIADAILNFLGIEFDNLISQQINLL